MQFKPAKEISIADGFNALQQAGKVVHPEHHTAQEAILGIVDVIHLTKSKRFLDEAMPALMQAVREEVALTHLWQRKSSRSFASEKSRSTRRSFRHLCSLTGTSSASAGKT